MSESGSLMSGITTASSEDSDNSNRVNEKLKFATTEEVCQFRVPEGSSQKKVMDPAKKKEERRDDQKDQLPTRSHQCML